jgi:hypothetical protein
VSTLDERWRMTPGEIAEVARQQNDRDFAAGRMPTRHVEDVGVLTRVAIIMTEHQIQASGDDRARSA